MATFIKICGITCLEDARAACDAGADALGFVFWPESPRKIEARLASEILDACARDLVAVGVFVDAPPDVVAVTSQVVGLDIAQLHGSEGIDFMEHAGVDCWKAFRVRDDSVLPEADRFRAGGYEVLLDAHVEGSAGGTGRTFNWDIAARAAGRGRILLAGGLTPGNIAEALERVRPFGVDVSSGVESRPGRKDAARVRAFVEEVRAWDNRIAGGISASSGASSSPKP